jgi:hypothetical protein
MADILGEVGQLVGNAVGGATTGGIGPAVGGFFELLNKFVPDKGQRAALVAQKEKEQADYAKALLEIQAAEHQKQLDMQAAEHAQQMENLKDQNEINKIQAGNSNLFVSGPRPFAQWSTTVIVLIGLLAVFVATCMKVDVSPFWPYFLFVGGAWLTLLGINAGLHTLERFNGVAPDQSPDGAPTPLPPRATLVKK